MWSSRPDLCIPSILHIKDCDTFSPSSLRWRHQVQSAIVLIIITPERPASSWNCQVTRPKGLVFSRSYRLSGKGYGQPRRRIATQRSSKKCLIFICWCIPIVLGGKKYFSISTVNLKFWVFRIMPNKVIIRSQITERLLMDALKKSIICRNAENYCMALATHFVESFNNMLNFSRQTDFIRDQAVSAALIWHFYTGMRTSIVRTQVSGFPSIKPEINDECAIQCLAHSTIW